MTPEEEDDFQFAPGELDRLLAEAEAEIERGEVVDCDAFFAELHRKYGADGNRFKETSDE